MSEIKIQSAIDHFKNGNYKQSKKEVWKLIETYPNDARVWKILGDTQIKLNRVLNILFIVIILLNPFMIYKKINFLPIAL